MTKRRCGACGEEFIKAIDLYNHIKICKLAEELTKAVDSLSNVASEYGVTSMGNKVKEPQQ